ncbi:MAG TPA: hypothetical protein GXX51_04215 [Firmicutes bacterium]|nr:hypothetical protein [Bacillota bacterium]
MSRLQRQREDHAANSVSLLISILVRYPQIVTVNFDPKHKTLKFTFMISEQISDERYAKFKMKLEENIETYAALIQSGKPDIELHMVRFEGFTSLEVKRDVQTLTQEEISLIIELVVAEFGDQLITERGEDSLLDEEISMQDEIIENMLEDLRESFQERDLIGFREEGRVLVFNKGAENRKS